MSIELIQDVRGFEELGQEWNELLASSVSDCLFLTWEWLSQWYRFQGKGRRLFLIAVRDAGRLVGLAPLVARPPSLMKMRPYPALEFLGSGNVGSDYLDFIIRRGFEAPVLEALEDFLTRRQVLLELPQVRLGASLAEVLMRKLSGNGWNHDQTAVNVCPYISLTGMDWPGYLATLGSSQRYNFQRRLKNLKQKFEFRFEPADDDEQRQVSLDALIRLHNVRWDQRGGSDAFHTPDLIEFHHGFSRLALQRGWLRLYCVYLNDAPAALLYGMLYQKKFYFYQSGFDAAFAKHSIGLVLMGLAIQSAIEEGVCEYDLLHGDEGYKSHWACQKREIGRLALYPPHLRGVIYRHVARAAASARRHAGRILQQYTNRSAAGAGNGGAHASQSD